jgi:nitrogen regulatory protein PII
MKRYLLVVIFSAFSLISGVAQSYKMHTVFIFSFTRYIQWPEAYNGGDFEILVFGDSPIVEELRSMAQSKKVGDRTIKVTKIDEVSEIRKCNILFISTSKSSQILEVLAKTTSLSTLVVTEEQGLGAKGSNVNFIIKDGKLAFELNQSATTKQGLKVSNELSRLAILI